MSTIPISKKCEMESQDSVVLSSCGEDESILLESVEETVENEGSDVDQGEYFLVSTVHEVAEEGDIKIFSEEISLDDNLSISDICRICANVNDHLIPIFKGEGLEHDLYNKIHKHLPIKVSEEDTLPLQLCYHCAATLLAWNDLSEGCLEAQSKLLQLQKQAEKRNSSTWQVEFTAEKIEENPPENVNFHETETLEQVQQEHDYLKSDEANDEVSNSERSSNRVCSSRSAYFKDFLRRFQVPLKSNSDDNTPQKSWYKKSKDSKRILNQTVEIPSNSRHPSTNETPADSNSPTIKQNLKKRKICTIDPFECDQCGKKFRLQESFRTHIRIHTGEKPYTCHVCGKQFGQTGSLYYHLKHVHGGVKNHSCDICGRSFAMKTAMQDHRRIHTGERPYVCDSCGKTFKTKASLYIHCKTHTNEYPHQCNFCKKSFRWKQQMLCHLTIHTGIKNHICNICGKAFGVKNDLTRHKKIHSKDKPFACQDCGVSFAQKRYLKSHQRTRHR